MTTEEVKSFLIKHKILENPVVTLLGQGESNVNYLAQNDSQQYVVRTLRSDVPSHNRFGAEHHFMLFIASLGINFAPRSIYYDQHSMVHVVSWVKGTDASILDLNDDQIDLFISQLRRLDKITYDEYLSWCVKTGENAHEPHTLANRYKINFEDRLQTIRKESADDKFAQQVLKWAEPKLGILREAGSEAKLRTVFLHDDLRWNEGGGNLKVDGEKLFFIDWELTGFYADTGLEIGDVIGSIPRSDHNQQIAKKLYEKYLANEPSKDDFDKSLRYGLLWGKLGNPIWAAERYFILRKSGHSNLDRYEKLAKMGMADAEIYFSLPLDRWFE